VNAPNHSPQAEEDVFQEVPLRALRMRKSFSDEGEVLAWAPLTAGNRGIDEVRHVGRAKSLKTGQKISVENRAQAALWPHSSWAKQFCWLAASTRRTGSLHLNKSECSL
jgi:DNA-directed RNA polymerase specialized sigma24 family protein